MNCLYLLLLLCCCSKSGNSSARNSVCSCTQDMDNCGCGRSNRREEPRNREGGCLPGYKAGTKAKAGTAAKALPSRFRMDRYAAVKNNNKK